MDEPMATIRRHHEAVLSEHQLFHALSELSAALSSGFSCSKGEAAAAVFSWIDDDGNLLAQLSRHGIFVVDVNINRKKMLRIAGICHLFGLPMFLDDDIDEMIERETPANANTTLN